MNVSYRRIDNTHFYVQENGILYFQEISIFVEISSENIGGVYTISGIGIGIGSGIGVECSF